jgi:hypothetical protein
VVLQLQSARTRYSDPHPITAITGSNPFLQLHTGRSRCLSVRTHPPLLPVCLRTYTHPPLNPTTQHTGLGRAQKSVGRKTPARKPTTNRGDVFCQRIDWPTDPGPTSNCEHYMMSASPPKDLDAEVGEQDQSPDEQEQHMDRGQQDASQQPTVFDFEVKEQDRWLPIANGESFLISSFVFRRSFLGLLTVAGSFISVRRFWNCCLSGNPLCLCFYFCFPLPPPVSPWASLLRSGYIYAR